MANRPNKVIVHHSAAKNPTPQFEAINQWHKDRGFPISVLGFYVGYHYVIEKSGDLRTARYEWEEGAHTVGQNSQSIGICLVGHFDIELPTAQQAATLGDMLASVCSRYNIDGNEIWAHRNFANKSCFGRLLSDDWARGVYYRHEIARLEVRLAALNIP